MSDLIPDKCGRCKSPIKPVWGQGRAALKCTRTDCEWEMSAQEYSDILHREERLKKNKTNEYIDQPGDDHDY